MEIKSLISDIQAIYYWLKSFLVFLGEKTTQWDNESKFIYPFVLSLVSAFVFWFIFSYLPQSNKYKKIRPIVELDLVGVIDGLWLSISPFLIISPHTSFVFQREFRGGRLKEDHIRLLIQNKCFSEKYLYDSGVPGKLIPIGKDVRKAALETERIIDKILSMNEFSSVEEIVLIERIRVELKRFQFGEDILESPHTIVNGIVLSPFVSNVDSMASSVFKLYCLLIELQKMVFLKVEKLDEDIQFRLKKMLFLFDSGDYKGVKSYLRKLKKKGIANEVIFKTHGVLSDYCGFNPKNARKNFISFLNQSRKDGDLPDILSSRQFFSMVIALDEEVVALLNDFYSLDEINNMRSLVDGEKQVLQSFIDCNKKIYEYFMSKDKRMPELSIEDFGVK